MGTYDHKKLLSDYTRGKIEVAMAMKHALQHIDNLYEAQTTAIPRRQEIRDRIDALEKEVNTLQAEADRLRAEVDQLKTVVDQGCSVLFIRTKILSVLVAKEHRLAGFNGYLVI